MGQHLPLTQKRASISLASQKYPHPPQFNGSIRMFLHPTSPAARRQHASPAGQFWFGKFASRGTVQEAVVLTGPKQEASLH